MLESDLDNLTILPPLFALVLHDLAFLQPMFIGLIIGLVFVAISLRLRALDRSGAMATLIMATTFFGVGGWAWSIPVILFFVLSSFLSHLGLRQKETLITEKGSCRDAGQVWANGGVAWLSMVVYSFWPAPVLYAVYLGNLAAMTADTWATEIGTWFGQRHTILITTLRPCTPGTSGGISWPGTIACILGAIVMYASGWLADPGFMNRWGSGSAMLGIVGAGLVGSFGDSWLGAAWQARFTCVRCGQTTEKRCHCGESAKPTQGLPWLRNDQVNFIASCLGGAWAAGIWWVAL